MDKSRRKFLWQLPAAVALLTGCRPDDPKPKPRIKKLEFGMQLASHPQGSQRPAVQDIKNAACAGYASIRINFMNNFDGLTGPGAIIRIRDDIVALRDAARQENIPLTFHGTINLRESVYQALMPEGNATGPEKDAFNYLRNMGIRFSNAGPRSAETDLTKTENSES